MHNDLVRKVAELMGEQAAAYQRLDAATNQLTAALVRGEPNGIEALTRAGESELLRMRSRLVEITSLLTKFTDMRASEPEKTPLEREVREQFEAQAQKLLDCAREFRKIVARAANLALGGVSFSNACIQQCGVPPTTYNAPILKNHEGAGR